MNRLKILIVVILILSLFSGCEKKNESRDYRKNLYAAYSNTLAQDMFNDVFGVLFQAFYDTSLHNQGEKNIFGADVHYSVINPDTTIIHVDYPAWNQKCPDSLFRKNDYIAIVTNPFTDTSGIASIGFEGYAVENHWLSGEVQITAAINPENQKTSFSVRTEMIRIELYDTSGTISWQGDLSYLWEEGEASPQNFTDDVFLISGTTEGISYAGSAYTTSIIDEIVKTMSCHWFDGGSYHIYTPGLGTAAGSVVFDPDACNTMFDMVFDGIPFYQDILLIYLPLME